MSVVIERIVCGFLTAKIQDVVFRFVPACCPVCEYKRFTETCWHHLRIYSNFWYSPFSLQEGATIQNTKYEVIKCARCPTRGGRKSVSCRRGRGELDPWCCLSWWRNGVFVAGNLL